MHSNFVTPPDIITAKKHTVLLIDPVWQDIEAVAMICKTIGTDFNVYIYDADMNDLEWLNTAASKSDTVVINTVPNQLTPTKDKLADLDKSHYYGPKNFLSNNKRIANPQEYFINYARQQSSTPAL